MNTPTNQPSAKCAALARSLMIWIKQDDVGHEFVAHQLAELESIAVADMAARAEAAEAACKIKDEALVRRHHEQGYMMPKYMTDALALTPAETRSVIAGLREDNSAYLKRIQEMYWATGNLVGDELSAVKQLTSERDALRARVAELEHWKSEQMAVESEWDAQAVGHLLGIPLGYSIRAGIEFKVRQMQAQLAALISAGNAMRRLTHGYACEVGDACADTVITTWDAAVSGAQAGAKGEKS